MNTNLRRGFWTEAFAIQGSVTPFILPQVLIFGAVAALITWAAWALESRYGILIALQVAPFELAGAALGLLLILRTNAGHDRWWEARKLWGGIVNQSRNVVISGLSYGPANAKWRERFVAWAATFPHVAKSSLRGEPPGHEVVELLGPKDASELKRSTHMPGFVAMKLADLLREACEKYDMDRFAFMQIDRERATLIDHIGACERILKTPLPKAYAIKIRRFLVLFLFTLPFALLHQLEALWLIPVITTMVAYPLISLDQIGVELQNPFSKANLSHHPLNEISSTIERNVLGFLDEKSREDEVPTSLGIDADQVDERTAVRQVG